MNQKNGRTDPGPLRERARSLFISQATIDETLEWATITPEILRKLVEGLR